MAVVKKYQNGGFAETKTDPTQSFENFISNKLAQTKFTKKGEQYARQSASQFAKLVGSENFDEVYSYDPISQQYSINTDKISDPVLKEYDWSGSKDAIQKNIIGQYSGKADKSNIGEELAEQKKFNSLMASWINEYKNLKKPTTSNTIEQELGVDKKIDNLWSYISKEGYNDPEGKFASSEWSKITDPEIRKQKVKQHAFNLTERFLKGYSEKGANRYSESEIEKVKKLREALDSGNWDSFKESAVSLGWDIDKLIEISTTEEDLQKQNQERIKKAIEIGTSPELAERGFIKINDSNNPLWKHRKSNEDIYEKDGKFYLIGITDQGFTFGNRFITDRGENYGGVLMTSDQGTNFLQSGSWEERDLNKELMASLNQIRQTPEKIIQPDIDNYINVFGQSEQLFPLIDPSGAKVFGSPTKNWFGDRTISQNVFGHLDPTQSIFRQEGGNWVSYEKGSDGKYYRTGSYDENFNIIDQEKSDVPSDINVNFNVSEFDESSFFPYYRRNLAKFGVSQDFDQSALQLPAEGAIKYIRGLYENAKNKDTSTQHTRDILVSYMQTLQKNNPDNYRTLLFKLPKDVQDFISGKTNEMNVSEMEEYKMPNWWDNMRILGEKIRYGGVLPTTHKAFPIRKKGGTIQKLQDGGKTQTWEEYLKKYNISSQPVVTENTVEKTVNPTKTRAIGSGPVSTKGESLNKAIMAANIGSLAPGVVGLGSALGATGLELARDIQDPSKSGWEVAGNLALNIGLAGAAFFGAGFLRGAKSGAKIASNIIKASDTVSDVKKVITTMDKASDISKVTKGAVSGLDDINKSIKNIEKYQKLIKSKNPLTLEQLATKANSNIASKKLVKSSKSVIEDIGKVLAFSEGISKSKSFSSLLESGEVAGKLLRTGTSAMVISSGVSNLPQAMETLGKVKDVITGEEKVGNITVDDVNSLVSVLFAGKVGSLYGKRAIAKKYGTIATGKSASKVDVTFKNGKTITLEGSSKPSANFLKKPTDRLSGDDKAKLLVEYNKTLPKDKQVKTLPKINSVKGFTPERILGRRVRNEGEWDYSKNVGLQKKATQWANRYRVGDQSSFTSKTQYGKTMDMLHNVTPKPKVVNPVVPPKPKRVIKKKYVPNVIKETLVLPPNKPMLALPPNKPMLALPKAPYRMPERWLKKGGKIIKGQNGLTFESWLKGKKPTFGLNKTFDIGTPPKFEINEIPFNQTKVKNYLEKPVNYTSSSDISLTPKSNVLQSLGIDSSKVWSELQPKNVYSSTSVNATKSKTGFATDIINEVKNKGINLPKFDVDKVDVMNALQAYNTIQGNKSAARSMTKAAVSQMIPSQLLSKQYIKSSTPNTLLASKTASGLINTGGRLAKASTNLALGTATQLEAAKKASDVMTNASLVDQQVAQKINELRSNLNLQVNQNNLGIINQNKQRMAAGEAAVHQVEAGLQTANTTAINTLLKSIGENFKVRDLEKTRAELVNMQNDPEFNEALQNYQNIASGDEYKKLYNQYTTAMNQPDVTKVSWEESDYGKTWKDKLESARLALEPYTKKMQTVQSVAMMGVPYSRIKW